MTTPGPDQAEPAPAEATLRLRATQVREASGIYGLIVTAAVLASAGGHLRTAQLEVAVFVTLVAYWLAEEYAELGEHVSAGHLPTWPHIRSALAAKWPMVSASYIPLLTLVVVRLIGASPSGAAYLALAVTVLLLTWYGWAAGRTAGLRGFSLFLITASATALGMLMICLKILITHWH